MKEIFQTVDKKSLVLSIIFKISAYICWYLFALVMIVFLNGIFTKTKLVELILAVFIVYSIWTIFKHFYKKNVDNAYYSIKHSSEMFYFKRLEKLNPQTLEHIDKEYLGNKILEVTYNITRIISDIFEYMIPLFIGILVFTIILADVSILLPFLVLGIICLIILYEYKIYEDEESSNYNDLLKDFVNKLPDIRMLNAFSFCSKRLDKNTSNICIIRNNVKYDFIYDFVMLALLFVCIISSVFIIKHTITIMGFILFFVIMGIKLKTLVYMVVPTIKNIQNYKINKAILESYYQELNTERHVSDWKKVTIKDAKFTYKSGINIKIPNFEFDRGDNVSILGATGMGKSTLLYILSGMYELNEGKIYVDGVETKSKIDSMYITRNTKMFKLSLRDNLTLGIRIEDEDLLKLIKEIDVVEWYESLSDGLDTIIDINYINLPDTVREKLNILRGIISTKDTLLLDEPTYDLDMEDEKIIANMIKKYWKKKSYIIITHRPIFTTICKKHYFMKNHELLESEPLL